ncbi:L-iditol 2-dehydrogenase [Paramicrobacterium humi]|uniref:L-iditol 2-dehydrogenase n=1 Tax=Paramicrobacterium humi TaxID=640635 RepID=A0A1H4JHX2_9MICO|nr:alcohol dehydrogenase catalytic domain-containing protein [Microbacterium humi]SEB45914.1 L-iditol 2-dehydrogenase [Microbacterium humi]
MPPERTLAVVKAAAGEAGVELREIPVPSAAPGFARLRVVATGVCGTDVHIARDEYGYESPVVMGHEILGAVDQVGDDADAGLLGRRVATETYFSTCGSCDWCRDGRVNLCPSRRSIGSFENGGFASHVVVPVGSLHPLPPGLGDIDGVLSEPLACVAQCLCDPAVVSPGDRVLVTGPGAMGQLAAQVAAASGGRVTLAGLPADASRLEVAASLGLAVTTEVPPAEAFDVVIECSGSAPGAAAALRAARRGGRYVQVGIFGREVSIPFDLVLYKELTVTSGFASTPASWRRAMALIEQGRVSLGPLVTARVPVSRWSEAFDNVRSGAGIKTVILPD